MSMKHLDRETGLLALSKPAPSVPEEVQIAKKTKKKSSQPQPRHADSGSMRVDLKALLRNVNECEDNSSVCGTVYLIGLGSI